MTEIYFSLKSSPKWMFLISIELSSNPDSFQFVAPPSLIQSFQDCSTALHQACRRGKIVDDGAQGGFMGQPAHISLAKSQPQGYT